MKRKTVRGRGAKRARPAKKMKPAMVPVATMPKKYFKQLMRLREDQWKPLSQKFGERRKPSPEKKAKWRILRAKVVTELTGTRQEAEQKMDQLFAKAPKGVSFWLEEVPSRRVRRIK